MTDDRPAGGPVSSGPERRPNWLARRREKARAEIERNRRGEPAIPTWVLVVTLVVLVVGWTTLIALA
jgi:hypothetical protein